MPETELKIRRTVWAWVAAFSVLLVLFGLATWLLKGRIRNRARWIAVETPSYAVAGSLCEIRITLGTIPEPNHIDAILSWEGKNHSPGGHFNLAEYAPEPRSGRTYVLKFQVQDIEAMKYVYPVIVLTPTRNWNAITNGAMTEPFPVIRPGEAATPPTYRKVPAYSFRTGRGRRTAGEDEEQVEGRRTGLITPVAGRLGLFVLLTAGAGLSWALSARRRAGRNRVRRLVCLSWTCFGAFLVLAGFGELFGLDHKATSLARHLARSENLYYMRRAFQEAVIIVLAAAAVSLFLVSIGSLVQGKLRFATWLSEMGLLGYVTVSLVDMVSFHAVDRLRWMVIGGIPVIDALKALGALAVIAGLYWNLKDARRAAEARRATS